MKLGELRIGSRVREEKSGLIFMVAAHDHPGYPGTLLVTDSVINEHSFDAKEPEGSDDNKKYGRNAFPVSNLCSWLNSDKESWYAPAHGQDAPPAEENVFEAQYAYLNEPGFLTRLSQGFKSAVKTSFVPCLVPDNAGGWKLTQCELLVAVPSLTELGFNTNSTPVEGSLIPVFKDLRARLAAPDASALGIDDRNYCHTGWNWWYWTRTPDVTNDCLAWYIQPGLGYGKNCGEYPCYAQTGVRPMMTLDGGVTVPEQPDEYGIWPLLV